MGGLLPVSISICNRGVLPMSVESAEKMSLYLSQSSSNCFLYSPSISLSFNSTLRCISISAGDTIKEDISLGSGSASLSNSSLLSYPLSLPKDIPASVLISEISISSLSKCPTT